MQKIGNFLLLLVSIAVTVLGWLLARSVGVWGWAVAGAGILMTVAFLARLLVAGKRTRGDSLVTQESEREKPEYRRKKTLLSRVERDFLQVLRGILDPNKYEIIVQVPLVAVIDKLTQNSYRNELFRVADYCVVDSGTYAPLLLIELNDASHTRADRMERDRKVQEICTRAGMPLVAFGMTEAGDSAFVRKVVMKNMLKK